MEVLQTEQALLGSVIKKGDLLKEISLEEGHFSDAKHRLIYRAMKDIDTKGDWIDIVSLNIYLSQHHNFLSSDYLADLAASVPTTENFKQYEKYIHDAYKVREARKIFSQADQEIINPIDTSFIQDILTKAQNLMDDGEKRKFDMDEALLNLYDELTKVKDGVTGIPTGFTDLDKLLDGWKLEDLNIVAARPSMGKTAFMLALANNAAKTGNFTTIFSLEMPAQSLLKRMICMLANIDSMKLRNPKKYFNDDDWEKYINAQGVLSSYKENLYIDDNSSPTVQDIRSLVRRNIRIHPNRRHIVMIDYLTLIRGSGKENRNQEIGEITRSLKKMARELNVSVIVLSQLSRKVEQRQDKRPILSDLRDSGEIEQDADTITFLYRDDYYNADTEHKNIVELIVAKHRNGPIGKVELAFLKEYNAFVSLQR